MEAVVDSAVCCGNIPVPLQRHDMRNPNSHEPDPPGGRSAERLREFIESHLDPDSPGPEASELNGEPIRDSSQESSKPDANEDLTQLERDESAKDSSDTSR